MEVPMIVVYKGSFISFWIAKSLVDVPYISLVNLIAGKRLVPELIQDGLTPEGLKEKAVQMIRNKGLRNMIKKELKKIHDSLGKGGASERAAKIAIEMIG
jgi:lipid-A-disaccharide synthase